MSTSLLILEVIIYSLALWLGLYLLARNPARLRLRLASFGLLAYALSIGSDLLARHAATPSLAALFIRLHWPLLFLPAFFWLGTIIYLLPAESRWQSYLSGLWRFGLLPTAVLFYILSAGTDLVFDFTAAMPRPGPGYFLFAGAVLLPMLAALVLAGWAFFRTRQPRIPLGLILISTLFFGLGASLLVFPLDWLPRTWLLLGVSLDFVVLGLVIALLDAFDEGETLRLDIARSFDSALFAVLLFGGLVSLTMIFSTGVTFPMLALLLSTIAAAIFIETLADPLQAAIDRLAFAALPQLRQNRADLRAAASVLPRVDRTLDLETVEKPEFERWTRRALSHMGDLPRLSGSPLTRLPLIDLRLAQRGAKIGTLERAAELKALLTESIARLKPRGKGEFGSSEEWRYYNALHFPYVVGLKPYSRRAEHDDLDPVAQEALDWLRTYVPERTLYNWQSAAANLVAQDLRERQREAVRQNSRGVEAQRSKVPG